MVINLSPVKPPTLQITSSLFFEEEILAVVCTDCDHHFHADLDQTIIECEVCGTEAFLQDLIEYRALEAISGDSNFFP